MSNTAGLLIMLITSVSFVLIGIWFVREKRQTLESFIVFRNSAGSVVTTATLVASVIGAWILFSPAETGTWAGIVGLIGYSLGQAAPLVAFVFIGARMRRLMPEGHSLTEYVWHRYGKGLYYITISVTIFYMFIFLSAELTGISQVVHLLADTPLGVTAIIVGLLTVLYTAYGGIRASIVTDTVQFFLILPLLVIIFAVVASSLDGLGATFESVSSSRPELLSLTHRPGIEFGITLIIAILAANLFHQGFWQRVYTAKSEKSLRRGFLISGVIAIPIIIIAGLFGIIAVGSDLSETPSVALFSLVLDTIPGWALMVVLILAIVLVMSSLDTLLNGMASTVTIDLARSKPLLHSKTLLRSSRFITVILIIPAILIASKGYSVLYLFLIADMVCAAVVFPVFYGLYSGRFSGKSAVLGSVSGLAAGILFFPTTAAPYLTGLIINIDWATQLLVSFSAAFGISVLVSLISMLLLKLSHNTSEDYDYSHLQTKVKLIDS